MNLCIDTGNSRIKIGIFNRSGQTQVMMFDKFSDINLPEIISNYDIQKAIISSTIEIPEHIMRDLEEIQKYFVLDHLTRLPFSNEYHSKVTLGRDRIALIAAAHSKHPNQNNLVIGCGTCITFNFINKENEFIGGSIHPGLKMRLQAMHAFTGKLPLITLAGNPVLIGTDTTSNMLSGVLFAAAKEIDGMTDEYLVKFPQLNVFITGGDAEMLVYRLKNEIFAIPNFTLIGLNHILEYNA